MVNGLILDVSIQLNSFNFCGCTKVKYDIKKSKERTKILQYLEHLREGILSAVILKANLHIFLEKKSVEPFEWYTIDILLS